MTFCFGDRLTFRLPLFCKRAVRTIYNLGRREFLREKVKETIIMTVPCQFIYENIMYIVKIKYKNEVY